MQICHPIEYHRNTIHPSIVALHYLSLVPVSLCLILLHYIDTGMTWAFYEKPCRAAAVRGPSLCRERSPVPNLQPRRFDYHSGNPQCDATMRQLKEKVESVLQRPFFTLVPPSGSFGDLEDTIDEWRVCLGPRYRPASCHSLGGRWRQSCYLIRP